MWLGLLGSRSFLLSRVSSDRPPVDVVTRLYHYPTDEQIKDMRLLIVRGRKMEG